MVKVWLGFVTKYIYSSTVLKYTFVALFIFYASLYFDFKISKNGSTHFLPASDTTTSYSKAKHLYTCTMSLARHLCLSIQ